MSKNNLNQSKKPKQGWEEKFKEAGRNGAVPLLIDDVFEDELFDGEVFE